MKKLGLVAAIGSAIAGAGAFFLGTKKGQAITKKAMTKTEAMVDEVAAKLEAAKDLTEEKYKEILAASVKVWKEAKTATEEEINDAILRIEHAWKEMVKSHHSSPGHKCPDC